MILEVCVDSLASARAAIRGGADRLELCCALAMGGLTPYASLLAQIRQESTIPIRCLMRPRAGDFLYTPEEISMLADQISALRRLGAEGFVMGCLTPEGTLDAPAMAPLLEAARGCSLTLHRCIDVSRDLEETYLAAAELGFDTVLTSGGAPNCHAGRDSIASLLALRDRINGPEVLIGAGVSSQIITAFRRELPNARAFHMSGSTGVESGMRFRREGIPMGIPGFDEWHIKQTSQSIIEAAVSALNAQF